jgi:hypothetical protein
LTRYVEHVLRRYTGGGGAAAASFSIDFTGDNEVQWMEFLSFSLFVKAREIGVLPATVCVVFLPRLEVAGSFARRLFSPCSLCVHTVYFLHLYSALLRVYDVLTPRLLPVPRAGR